MPTANSRKGAEAERIVARYLREQGFPEADRRLREGRADDQGDIDGVPFTTIQVKYVAKPAYQAWVTDTLKQRDTAGTPLCLLVRRVPQKPVSQWEALMPSSYFIASFEDFEGNLIGGVGEGEAWTWIRMDLRLAVFALKRMTEALRTLSVQSSPTTWTEWVTTNGIGEPSSAPSTEKDAPPSPTT